MLRSRIQLALVLALMLAGAPTAHAQSTAKPWTPAHWTAVFGIHIGTPDRFSVVMGAGRVLSSRALGPALKSGKVPHSDRDVFVAFEPGSRGARLSVGYGGFKDMVNQGSVLTGRISAYRHWSDDSSRVYIGPEISGSAMADVALGMRLGVLRRVYGPEGRRFIVPRDYAVGW